MGLETPVWISDLNPSNPLATDLVSQGDDHIRNLKTALQNTFPGANRPFPIPTSITKTANYVVASTDQNKVLVMGTGAGAVNVVLPALTATDYGWRVEVMKGTTDSNPVMVFPNPGGTVISGPLTTLAKTRRAVPWVRFACEWVEGVWVVERVNRLPLGTIIDNLISGLPAGYEYAMGQSTSSSFYPDYLSAAGTSVLPDLQGRATFARPDMDGSNNNVLIGLASATTLGAAGGTSSVSIAQVNLPNFNLSLVSLTCAGTVTITDPTHAHGPPNGASGYICNDGAGLASTAAGGSWGINGSTAGVATGITAGFSSGSVGGTLPSGGSGIATMLLPPLMIVNKLVIVE